MARKQREHEVVYAIKLLFNGDKLVKWLAYTERRGVMMTKFWFSRFTSPDLEGCRRVARDWRKEGFKARVVHVRRKVKG